ncbi:MAG: hypothetical protein MI674_02005 [Cytophagales bacterium]|nr:hypothetical protein [Cytophagales bacterium]
MLKNYLTITLGATLLVAGCGKGIKYELPSEQQQRKLVIAQEEAPNKDVYVFMEEVIEIDKTTVGDENGWQPAIYNLKSGGQLTNFTVHTFLKCLAKTYPSLACVEELVLLPPLEKGETRLERLLKEFKEKLEKAQGLGESGVVFVPLILESSWKNYSSWPGIKEFAINHIACLVLDIRNGNLEYYDSEGGEIDKEIREVKGLDILLSQLCEALKEVKGQWEIHNYKTRHQGWFDNSNCGVFVAHFIKARFGESLNGTPQPPIMRIDPSKYREKMIAIIEGEQGVAQDGSFIVENFREILKTNLANIETDQAASSSQAGGVLPAASQEEGDNYVIVDKEDYYIVDEEKAIDIDLEKNRKCLERNLRKAAERGKNDYVKNLLKIPPIRLTFDLTEGCSEDSIGQIYRDLKGGMELQIGPDNISQKIADYRKKTEGKKEIPEELLQEAIQKIKEEIPMCSRDSIFPYMEQGATALVIVPLWKLSNDLATGIIKIAPGHNDTMSASIKISENLDTVWVKFSIKIQEGQADPNGIPVIVKFRASTTDHKAICSFERCMEKNPSPNEQPDMSKSGDSKKRGGLLDSITSLLPSWVR